MMAVNHSLIMLIRFVSKFKPISSPPLGNTVSEIQVHFAPGEAKKTASFTLPDDTVHDETRHFTVHLIPTSNILLEGLTEVHITALDNDGETALC